MPTCGWAVHPGTETLHPERNEGLVAVLHSRGRHVGTVVGGSSPGGQDASVLCGDAGDVPGRRKWELWGWEWSGVGERSRAECLLPSVPQTLHPARGWLFPQSILSCISVQLWAPRVGAGPGRGALVNTCQEMGALSGLW